MSKTENIFFKDNFRRTKVRRARRREFSKSSSRITDVIESCVL